MLAGYLAAAKNPAKEAVAALDASNADNFVTRHLKSKE